MEQGSAKPNPQAVALVPLVHRYRDALASWMKWLQVGATLSAAGAGGFLGFGCEYSGLLEVDSGSVTVLCEEI